VIDSGVDISHEDLKIDFGPIPMNSRQGGKIDDDGNGYIERCQWL